MHKFYLKHENGIVEAKQGKLAGKVNSEEAFAKQFNAVPATSKDYDDYLDSMREDDLSRQQAKVNSKKRKVQLLEKAGLTNKEAEEFIEL